jgi:hypothetical protein
VVATAETGVRAAAVVLSHGSVASQTVDLAAGDNENASTTSRPPSPVPWCAIGLGATGRRHRPENDVAFAAMPVEGPEVLWWSRAPPAGNVGRRPRSRRLVTDIVDVADLRAQELVTYRRW